MTSNFNSTIKRALLEGLARHSQFFSGIPVELREAGTYTRVNGHFAIDSIVADIGSAVEAQMILRSAAPAPAAREPADWADPAEPAELHEV